MLFRTNAHSGPRRDIWSVSANLFVIISAGNLLGPCDIAYRGSSPMRNSAPLGPYSRTMPTALWWPLGGGLFLMSEVPLYSKVYGLSTSGLFKKWLCSPLCGDTKTCKERIFRSQQRMQLPFSIRKQLLRRIIKRCRGGLVLKAHRPFYHSILG